MPDYVAAAREWIGTPFDWDQSCKGAGADCKGLIAGVARDCGRPEGNSLEALTRGYFRGVPVDALKAGLERLFDRVNEWEPGDILLLKIGGKPCHLAIYVGEGRMIHTYSKGPQAVVEVPMGRVWRNAVESAWRWRDAR